MELTLKNWVRGFWGGGRRNEKEADDDIDVLDFKTRGNNVSRVPPKAKEKRKKEAMSNPNRAAELGPQKGGQEGAHYEISDSRDIHYYESKVLTLVPPKGTLDRSVFS